MHRPLRLATALALAAALLIAGCGSDAPDSEPAASPADDAAFPAAVEHRFGITTVPAEPERIVVVGLTEQDTVLALGLHADRHHGVVRRAAQRRVALGAGAARRREADGPEQADGLQFERIAGLAPDLIIGTNAGIERKDYEKLSQIAPTISSAKDSSDYFSPWDDQVELVAAALGKPDEGQP